MSAFEEDSSFRCCHVSCKRIKTNSYQFIYANKIKKIKLQPDVITDDIVYNVYVPQNSPWKTLCRFVYPDNDSNTITIPIICDTDLFLATNTTLFTMCGITVNSAWNLLDEDIFYSDTDSDDSYNDCNNGIDNPPNDLESKVYEKEDNNEEDSVQEEDNTASELDNNKKVEEDLVETDNPPQ